MTEKELSKLFGFKKTMDFYMDQHKGKEVPMTLSNRTAKILSQAIAEIVIDHTIYNHSFINGAGERVLITRPIAKK